MTPHVDLMLFEASSNLLVKYFFLTVLIKWLYLFLNF